MTDALPGFQPKAPKKPKPQDSLWKALAGLEGGRVQWAGGQIAKARKLILAASPDVTPDEVRARGARLSQRWAGRATVSPLALAKWWRTLEPEPDVPGRAETAPGDVMGGTR